VIGSIFLAIFAVVWYPIKRMLKGKQESGPTESKTDEIMLFWGLVSRGHVWPAKPSFACRSWRRIVGVSATTQKAMKVRAVVADFRPLEGTHPARLCGAHRHGVGRRSSACLCAALIAGPRDCRSLIYPPASGRLERKNCCGRW
jgi:hypothetical protein